MDPLPKSVYLPAQILHCKKEDFVTFNALSQRYLYNISMHSGIVHVTPHRPAMLHLGKRDYGHLISQYLKSEGWTQQIKGGLNGYIFNLLFYI